MKKTIFGFFCVLVLSFWSIRALLNWDYFPMHDDTQVGRVVSMGRALKEGQFPVRWVNDLGFGYGYPLFNFYGPLPYYIGGIFHALGLTGLTATKLVFLLGILLASTTMYVTVASLYGRILGIIAALFYTYHPYHAVQIYVRGSVGEYWTLVFLPLFMWSIFSMLHGKNTKRPLFIGIFSLFGIITSHTIIGYITVLFFSIALLLLFCFSVLGKKLYFLHVLNFGKILAGGLGLSAFFWLPALLEMQFTNVVSQIGPTADFRDHFLCFGQLWNSVWGFGGSQAGCIDGMSFKLGKLHVLLSLIGVLLLFRKKFELESKRIILVSLVITLVSIFFVLQWSRFFWESLPRMDFIQYPWRFLTFTLYSLSLLSVSALLIFKNIKIRLFIGILMTLLLLIFNIKLFQPQYLYSREASEFESLEDLRFRVSKISHEYLPKYFQLPATIDMIRRDTISASRNYTARVISEGTLHGQYAIEVNNPISLTINKAYFPSWRYFVDGKPRVPEVKNGLPIFLLSAGTHTLTMQWNDTRIEILGNLITIFTAVSIIFFYVKQKRKIVS